MVTSGRESGSCCLPNGPSRKVRWVAIVVLSVGPLFVGAPRPLIVGLAVLLIAPATSHAVGHVDLSPAAGAGGASTVLHASGFPRSKRVLIRVTGGRSWSLTTSRSGTFMAGITMPIREGWWSVVSQSGRSRAINRFHVTSHGPGGQVIDVASTRGQRLRITPAGLFPGGTVQLRGAAFGRSHTLTVAGFAVTRTVKASRTGSFSAKIVVPAATAPGPSKVVVSGGGPRFSVTLHVFRSPAAAGGGAVPPVFTTPTLPNALWHMDDSGTVMVDSAGHHDGILHNIETGRPGSIGSAFGFNGSTSYAWVAPAADLSAGAADVTLSIRMRTSKLPPVSTDDWDLIGSGDSFTDGNEYKVEYYPNGTVE